jgi:hypothetical protein
MSRNAGSGSWQEAENSPTAAPARWFLGLATSCNSCPGAMRCCSRRTFLPRGSACSPGTPTIRFRVSAA